MTEPMTTSGSGGQPRRRADDRSGWELRASAQPTVSVADLDIEVSSLRQAVDDIDAVLVDDGPQLVVTVNVDQTLHARDRADVRAAYRQARLRYADGAPVVALARLMGADLPGRVTGADLVPALCSYASRHNRRVAMIGGRPGVAARAADALRCSYPGLQVVLVESPPLGFERDPAENARLVHRLRQVRPHYVFVALGAPKQEMWVHAQREHLPAGAYIGVGGSLDFLAGVTKRAPQLWQRLGLEWLHRLLHDWQRLWRRYLVNDLRFVSVALTDLRRRRRVAAAKRRGRSADVLPFAPSATPTTPRDGLGDVSAAQQSAG